MRFIQIICKEKKWKVYALGAYAVLIVFFYGVQYFYYQQTQELLWLSLNTVAGRLVQHPFIWLFFMVDIFPVVFAFLCNQKQYEKYFRWFVFFLIIPVDLFYFWQVGLPFNWILFNLLTVGMLNSQQHIRA